VLLAVLVLEFGVPDTGTRVVRATGRSSDAFRRFRRCSAGDAAHSGRVSYTDAARSGRTRRRRSGACTRRRWASADHHAGARCSGRTPGGDRTRRAAEQKWLHKPT
jgi:hypothetical protein